MKAATRRTREDTARLGDEIYEKSIRQVVEADNEGDYVAIDVDSGDHAIADTVLIAAERLREKRPGATNVCLLRIGHRTLGRIGGGHLKGPL